ncbi:hypothetical protein N7513_008502 [Penicillium frequentans]|nr:hypothetical protein N7513_008502 [Penicillium glabrum]
MPFHTFSARPPNEFQPQDPNKISGHGRQLTDDEKSTLVKVCHDLAHWGTFSEQPKSFWMEASRVFESQVNRSYGWQACRRCMAKWEADNRPACLERPSIPSPTVSFASLATQTDADAEGLPHHPRPLVRNSTKRTVSETMAKRKEFCRSVSGAVKDLERKIQYINDALDDDNLEHRRAIENTLGLLKLQIAGSMARFENRAPE